MYINSKYMDDITLKQQEEAVATMESCCAQYGVVRKIVTAATLYHGVLIVSVRHFDRTAHTQLLRLFGEKDEREHNSEYEQVQGFVDQYGVFVDRKTAMGIVLESGQPFNIKRNGGDIRELFSEGIH